MATTFTTVTAPQLENLECIKVIGGTRPPGSLSSAPTGEQWWRNEYRLSLYRIGEGLTSFTPIPGVEKAGNTLTWTGGAATILGNVAQTYTSNDHSLTQEYAGADIWRESIVYTWFGKWELETAPASENDDGDFS